MKKPQLKCVLCGKPFKTFIARLPVCDSSHATIGKKKKR
jgi:hypothetical protein